MREPLHCLAFESFSHFQLQDEHNASCFFMSAALIRHKNRCKYTKKSERQVGWGDFSKIFPFLYPKKTYFCAIKLDTLD